MQLVRLKRLGDSWREPLAAMPGLAKDVVNDPRTESLEDV